MAQWAVQWWGQLRIQHKVWTVLFLLCVPLMAGLSAHLYITQQLLAVQQQRHELVLVREHVEILRRLVNDIEGGFRGYVLTQQPVFLAQLTEAEARVDSALAAAAMRLSSLAGFSDGLDPIARQLKELLRSKHELLADIQRGGMATAQAYVRLGERLQQSDRLRQDLLLLEDRLQLQRQLVNDRAEALSHRTFVGLWVALAGVVLLGWTSSRMLARSLTDPIMRLQSVTARIGKDVDPAEVGSLLASVCTSKDEFGQLAKAYLTMAGRIGTHIQELEAINMIGHAINTIGPDGLTGVLRRISDRAVELVGADVCLVLIRNERMGCWVVEVASGEWSGRLDNSVMLWDELPVSVRAYETREVAIGEGFRADERPQVLRRNLIGDSMLAVPLLAQGEAFGVLALVCEQPRSAAAWNQRLAKGLAQEAALAISNVKLYEAAQQQQRGLLARLRQLEHLAETLAHDLKGPGARMGELARLLLQQYGGQFDDRTKRWLVLLEENSRDLEARVEGILTVARVGADQGAITAVDSAAIISDVLKARADEIERLHAVVQVEPGLPFVACHGAYLRQIFDNLLSNALKFARAGEPPFVKICGQVQGSMVMFSVEDHGIGIPPAQRGRVFQPFVRLLISEAPGSGIGLAIVQRIVDLYGGRVWIDGAERVGCTVCFTVPSFQEQEGTLDVRSQGERTSDVVAGVRRVDR